MSGAEWVKERIDGHPDVFHEHFGMHVHVFERLLAELERRSNFVDSKNVSAQEKLAIFLYYVVTGVSIRKLEGRFQRSKDTISKCVVFSYIVLFAINTSMFHYGRAIHEVLESC